MWVESGQCIASGCAPLMRADAGRGRAGGGGMHVGTVHVHVAAQPHHDERQVADMVHRKFQEAVHSQLNDGAFA